MSYANRRPQPLSTVEPEEVEGIAVGCRVCFQQPDKVYFNRANKLLFWKCPNGHEGFVEDFDILG